MDIGSVTGAFTAHATLALASATTAPSQADTSDGHTYQRAMGTSASAASNMLSTNFATTDATSSKYIKATLSSLQTQNSFGDRMGTLLDGLSAQYSLLASSMQVSSGNGTYVAATLMQHRVEEGVQRTTENEVADQSSKNLDDIKEDIEQRAQDATQPQDAASQTGQDATTDGAAATATAAAAASVSPAESDGAAETTSPTTGESAAPLAPSSPGMSEDAAAPATPTSATEFPLSAYAAQQATQAPTTTTTVDMQV
ncbi:hypothetical protein [Solidesulfovibrio alcoholivorans]|uniref:hypothetical protein n=1 Tax=Solidesulfovibrio alcoholivorans TaxID=81406 RepID=UPI00049730FE|nr:hypothetical protein [Solidesulfovibrio alcoholivorans]